MSKARAFWGQLTSFSREVLEGWGLPKQSPWGKAKWKSARRGAVVHHTIGKSLEKVARWFCDPSFNAGVCAHVIVGQTKLPELQSLESKYPAVAELPVTVVQCRPWTQPAVHATWLNSTCYGLELINAGVLSPQEGGWFDKRGHAVQPIAQPVKMHGRYWEPYTPEQIAATVMLLRMYRHAEPDSLMRNWVIGHEHVQGVETEGSSGKDKRDPGPLFPLYDVRNAAFTDSPIYELEWWDLFVGDEQYAVTWRDAFAIEYCRGLDGKQWPAADAWNRLMADVTEVAVEPDPPHPTVLDTTLLLALGYCADEGAPWPPTLKQFRRMAGLPASDRWDEAARAALRERVGDRGLTFSGTDHLI